MSIGCPCREYDFYHAAQEAAHREERRLEALGCVGGRVVPARVPRQVCPECKRPARLTERLDVPGTYYVEHIGMTDRTPELADLFLAGKPFPEQCSKGTCCYHQVSERVEGEGATAWKDVVERCCNCGTLKRLTYHLSRMEGHGPWAPLAWFRVTSLLEIDQDPTEHLDRPELEGVG